MGENDIASKISEHYHRYPYPNIPLFASVPKEQLWQINYDWLARKNGVVPTTENPSIWIAGCGTFQPYTLSQGNPTAKIFATDISESSLKIAKRRCFLHRKNNIDFSTLDLNQYESYPDQKFDWIECYGVLMSVKDPVKTLQEFTKRLKPGGFIRIMVYPHYGRQRIFQIQQIAKLLNLTLENPESPSTLKKLMRSLPDTHPLKYAFFSYDDSRNKEGIADAFLHPEDRAFTGIEICKVIESSSLEISYCMHRPWGQPKEMAAKLGLLHHDPALWLHYLDLWQNLRSNFVFCLRKKNSDYNLEKSDRHALLDFFQKGSGIKHRAHLARLALTGSKLQTRTEEDFLYLSAKDVRNVLLHSPEKLSIDKQKLFPGYDEVGSLPPLFQTTSKNIHPSMHFVPRLGGKSINPLYDYLFDAYRFSENLPPLLEQIRILRKVASPLESTQIGFGLTPLGTYNAKSLEVENLLKALPSTFEEPWENACLEREETKFNELTQKLESLAIAPPEDNVSYRKLWVLLHSEASLTLPFMPS